MARKADLEVEKQVRDLIVAGNPIKDIWQAFREQKLSRSRILEIRDEIASPLGLKWLADGLLLNSDKPHHSASRASVKRLWRPSSYPSSISSTGM